MSTARPFLPAVLGMVAALGLLTTACGDDGGAGEGAAFPEACAGAPGPVDLTVSSMEGLAEGPFVPESVFAFTQPIVPNGDGALDDLSPADFEERGAETDLLAHSVVLADYPIPEEERDGYVGLGRTPDPPPGGHLVIVTVVPTDEAGLAAGDVVRAEDEFGFDSITTFAPMGVFVLSGDQPDTYLFTERPGDGRLEVLGVDDDGVCLEVTQSGMTGDPDGTWSIDAVVAGEIVDRAELPFT